MVVSQSASLPSARLQELLKVQPNWPRCSKPKCKMRTRQKERMKTIEAQITRSISSIRVLIVFRRGQQIKDTFNISIKKLQNRSNNTILRVCQAYRHDQTRTKASKKPSSKTGSRNMEVKGRINNSIWVSRTKGRQEDISSSSTTVHRATIRTSIVATHSTKHMLRTRCSSNNVHMALRAKTRVFRMLQLLISTNKLQTIMVTEGILNMVMSSNSKSTATKLIRPVRILRASIRGNRALMGLEQAWDHHPRLACLLLHKNHHTDFLLFIKNFNIDFDFKGLINKKLK